MADALVFLRERQENGGYNRLHGMHVLTVREGYAEVSMPAASNVLNPLGNVHGGALYTLCDVAAGTACASRGKVGVTLSANINYLRPGHAGEELIAATKEIKVGAQTAVYEVTVMQGERHVATGIFTMFYVDQPLEALKA